MLGSHRRAKRRRSSNGYGKAMRLEGRRPGRFLADAHRPRFLETRFCEALLRMGREVGACIVAAFAMTMLQRPTQRQRRRTVRTCRVALAGGGVGRGHGLALHL